MKFLSFFIFSYLFLVPILSFAQIEDFCATPPSNIPDPPGVYSKSTDISDLDNFPSRSFNIFFWRINKDDGSYTQPGWPITLEKIKRSVDSLNHYYAPMKICFNLLGMDTINSTALHSGASFSQIKNYARDNGYEREDAFNIYAPESLSRGSGVTDYFETRIAIISGIVGEDYRTLYHEMGHCFNLIHTFGNSNYRPDPLNCEHVTRDPNDPNYNAEDNGDRVVDTNAVTNFQREQTNHFAYAVHEAGIVSTWDIGRTLSFSEDGFHNHPDAAAIEQALQNYGFTQQEIDHLRYNPAVLDAYYDIETAMYMPDGRIHQLSSPFFKNCEGIPYQVDQKDIQNMMSYSTSNIGYLFTPGQGIRMHEAIRDSIHIFGPLMSDHTVDLFIRDTEHDIGQEPNIHTDIFWNSQDIWVRNQNDGMTNKTHQNPVYNANNPNYVYVKVSNKGCTTSSGDDEIKLYWAKANTALNWEDYWVGNIFVNGIPMGGELDTLTIPPIDPGESEIIEFEWFVPDPEDYIGINPNPWHFCLLARIESDDDPMTFQEGTFITDNVRNNNNIAWKNTTIINISPYAYSLEVGGVIGVSNPSDTAKSYSLYFVADDDESGSEIFQEAEVGVVMDSVLLDAWKRGNKIKYNFSETAYENKVIVTGNNAKLDNILLDPNDYGTAYITFNFLTQELSNKQEYIYQVTQKENSSDRIMGGETYKIYKAPRIPFYADAGENKNVERNQSLALKAVDIDEDAIYNWYDSQNKFIDEGLNIMVSPSDTEEYRLEVISGIDGFKDYDDVIVTVLPYRILNMAPNPTSSQVTIQYRASGATAAHVRILNQTTGAFENYVIDPEQNEITIDMSVKPYGWYSAILICDGVIQDTKSLGKN